MITSEHGKVTITGNPQEYITDALLVLAQVKTNIFQLEDEETKTGALHTFNSLMPLVIQSETLDELVNHMVLIMLGKEGV